MKVLQLTPSNQAAVVAETVTVLAKGGLVLFPTETTYGAGVDATNPQAVAKLLQYKARREGKPLSIAVTDQTMASKFVIINDQAAALYDEFLPGPVTVVSKALPEAESGLAPGVTSEFGTVGVRIPAYPLVLEIIAALGAPMTATSANVSDQKRPYAIQDVLDRISQKQCELIDLIIDAGTLPPNPPSTVIDTTLSTPLIVRKGSVALSPSVTSETTLTSKSEQETKAIAGRIMLKHWNEVRAHGLVIGLDGSLGMGKTVFAKGVAEFLQIAEPVTSPTYSYIEEYDFTRHQTTGRFFHLDLWKIDSETELERLELEKLLAPNTVVVIEWFSQVAEPLLRLISKQSTPFIQVVFSEKNPLSKHPSRELQILE